MPCPIFLQNRIVACKICLPTIYLAVLLPLPTFADTCTEAETSFKRVTVSFRYSDGIPTR